MTSTMEEVFEGNMPTMAVGKRNPGFKKRLNELCKTANPPLMGYRGPSGTRLSEYIFTRTGAVVSKQACDTWLKGGREPGATSLYLLAEAFWVSARWLWLGTGPRAPRLLDRPDLQSIAERVSQLTDKEAINYLNATIDHLVATQQKKPDSK